MRRIITVAALGLAGATLTACGSPPDDASREDYCDAVDGFSSALMTGKIDEDKIEDAIDEIEEVGTPDDISDDAREGFEISLDLMKDVDWGADEEDLMDELEEIEDDVEKDDEKKLEAYEEYESETCE